MSNSIQQLKFLFERLYASHEIPIHLFDNQGTVLIRCGIKEDELDPFVTDRAMIGDFRINCHQHPYPLINYEKEIVVYGGFLDRLERLFIIGPVLQETPDLGKIHDYKVKHGMKNNDFSMKQKPLLSVMNVLSTLYMMVTGEMMDEKAILLKNRDSINAHLVNEKEVNQYLFRKSENRSEHLSYQYEQKYMSAIENGNLDFFQRTLLDEPKALEKIGLLAKNTLKQLEYMCVSSIVLISRAAIHGGVNPSESYALSELYLQKLELCKSSQELLNLQQIMVLDFVTKVREQKDKKRHEDYIEAAKDYVSQHVHFPIRMSEVAEVVGKNHSYLAKRFKEEEGMTMVQYSINAKLHAAANMLKYSETSLAEITDYFCFASQSRFGSQFKKKYGVTPMVYRKENRVIDFESKGLEKNRSTKGTI